LRFRPGSEGTKEAAREKRPLDGIPIAFLESDEVRYLEALDPGTEGRARMSLLGMPRPHRICAVYKGGSVRKRAVRLPEIKQHLNDLGRLANLRRNQASWSGATGIFAEQFERMSLEEVDRWSAQERDRQELGK
jgi:hypothetical protein